MGRRVVDQRERVAEIERVLEEFDDDGIEWDDESDDEASAEDRERDGFLVVSLAFGRYFIAIIILGTIARLVCDTK